MKKYFLVLLPALMLLSSCSVLQEAGKFANIVNCRFRLESVKQLTLAGVNVQNVKKLSDLTLVDGAKLATAVASGQFPLTFTLNTEVSNPNASSAKMTQFDWILLIDDIEMTAGTVNNSYTIPAKGASVIPMQINIDLKKALSGKSADAIINFGLNLAGTGNEPTRFTLKVRPTISVGAYSITYPNYMTVTTQYGS